MSGESSNRIDLIRITQRCARDTQDVNVPLKVKQQTKNINIIMNKNTERHYTTQD